MKSLMCATCLLLAACFGNARADTFKVGFYNYPPMMIEARRSGIYQEILNELSVMTGHRFEIQYLPYTRLTTLFDLGKIDLEPGVFPGWVKHHKVPGLFSVPFGKVVDTLVFAPGKHFNVSTPSDLSGRTLGLVRGYAYPTLRELFDSGAIHRADATSETQLLAMLAASRMDQILINKAVAQYNILHVFRVVGCLPSAENAIGPSNQAGRRRTSLKGGNRGMYRCGPMFNRPMGIWRLEWLRNTPVAAPALS